MDEPRPESPPGPAGDRLRRWAPWLVPLLVLAALASWAWFLSERADSGDEQIVIFTPAEREAVPDPLADPIFDDSPTVSGSETAPVGEAEPPADLEQLPGSESGEPQSSGAGSDDGAP